MTPRPRLTSTRQPGRVQRASYSRFARWRRGDAGSATLELAVLAPALLLLISAVVFAARYSQAAGAVDLAAATAAREATAGGNLRTATDQAELQLRAQAVPCRDVRVTVTRVPTTAGSVARATVTCDLALADIAAPGIPGRRSITATVDSPYDRYRP